MFSTTDTIVAIATAPGRAGLGVVRLSGPDAPAIAARLTRRHSPLEPRHATFAHVVDADDRVLDQAVVTWFPAPRSYTTEDVVEISAHGSPVVLSQIVEAARQAGARLARPGEFTFRAFVHGRIELTQAEAVADLIDAVTPRQARIACEQIDGALAGAIAAIDDRLLTLAAKLEASLDFPDEGYRFIEPDAVAEELRDIQGALDTLLARGAEGRVIRDGVTVALAGVPNSGKSTLFNRLVGSARSIVTEVPGTTRDLVTEVVEMNGVPVTLVDAAGLREAADPIEREGIRRAHAGVASATVVLLVLDRSQPLDSQAHVLASTRGKRRVIAVNKSDLPGWESGLLAGEAAAGRCEIAAVDGRGQPELQALLLEACGVAAPLWDAPYITHARHLEALSAASAALKRGTVAAVGHMPEEILITDLTEARTALGELTGTATPEHVVARIFERFCIGK